MSYIRFPSDPHPPSGDQSVNELVKIIETNGSALDHQTDINLFLVILRDLDTYVAIVRSIQTHVLKITGPNLEQYSVIRYTLIGQPDAPP